MLLSTAMIRHFFGPRTFVIAVFTAFAFAGCQGSSPKSDVLPVENPDPEVEKLFRELESAVRANGDDAVARGQLGMAKHANGLLEGALSDYEVARRLAPTDPKWFYLAGIIEADLGRIDRGLGLLDEALGIAPESSHVHWRRGLLLLDLGRFDAADSAFTRAIQLKPNHPVAWLGRARVALQRERAAQIVPELEEAIRRRPGSPYVPYFHQLLGTAYRQLGRFEEARIELAQGRAGRPPYTDPWTEDLAKYRVSVSSRFRQASALIQAGENEKAVDILLVLREEDPANATVLQYLSVAYMNLAAYEKARQVLEDSIELHPEDAIAHSNLSSALLNLGRVDEAMKMADRGLALNSVLPFTHVQRARVLRALQRNEESAEEYANALKISPMAPSILLAAAEVAEARGRWTEVESLATRALEHSPRLVEALVRRSRANARLGERALAAKDLELARSIEPNHPEVLAAGRTAGE